MTETLADHLKKLNEERPDRAADEQAAYDQTFFYGASSALACLLLGTRSRTVSFRKLRFTLREVMLFEGRVTSQASGDDPRRTNLALEWQRGERPKTDEHQTTYYRGAGALVDLLEALDVVKIDRVMREITDYWDAHPELSVSSAAPDEFPFTTVAEAVAAFLRDSGALTISKKILDDVTATFYAGAQCATMLICDETARPSAARVRAIAGELVAFVPDEDGARTRPVPRSHTLAEALLKITGNEAVKHPRGFAERERVFYTGAHVVLSLVTGRRGHDLDEACLEIDEARLIETMDELGSYAHKFLGRLN